ncbi:hypothetical protein ColLi_12706 [Colletotrichum liriopes]|uniref:Uncharacterized protein n=1 Tax=Colletotrichum liriopes TaxID=708192 RepID=A0AA37GYW4_9PEZI|nr:hypothetical protein ColLi_12706 [Colletotrichum liriopes]
MSAVPTEHDVAASLASLRQAQALHAAEQQRPGAIPDVWRTLRRQFWRHAWRLHIAGPAAAAAAATAADPADPARPWDVRDFVSFLRRQLSQEELDFALFVVFRQSRAHMRDAAPAEVKRRYAALKGNVGGLAEDALMLELGPRVLQSTTALKHLNSLLNPRNPADRLSPASVFRAVRDQMLARHTAADEHPDAAPPTSLPPSFTNHHSAQGLRWDANMESYQTDTVLSSVLRAPRAASVLSSARATPSSARDSLPPPPPPSLPPAARPKRDAASPLPGHQARRRRVNAEEEEEEEEQVQEDQEPEGSRADTRAPIGGQEIDPLLPLFPANNNDGDNNNNNNNINDNDDDGNDNGQMQPRTPPPPPSFGTTGGGSRPRRAALDQANQWADICRRIREMPPVYGSSLWRASVETLVQAADMVGQWCDQILDEDALGDD